jgi:hypothetical protein
LHFYGLCATPLHIKQQKSGENVPETAQPGSNLSTPVGELFFVFEYGKLSKNTLTMSLSVASDGY